MAQNTMYVSKNNSPQTALTNEITASEQTIPVADVSKLPAAPNIVSIGSGDNIELVYYAGISGSTLTGCVRGYHGTTASIWYEDTPVYRAYTSYDHDTFKGNIEDLAINKLDKTGNASSTTVTFTEAGTLENPATGESQSTLWGKILKLFNISTGHNHDGTNSKQISAINITGLFDSIYPIGSIYMSVNNTNPRTLFGGTWQAWGAGRVPVGFDSSQSEFDTVEETGGSKTHTLTETELPEITGSFGDIVMGFHTNYRSGHFAPAVQLWGSATYQIASGEMTTTPYGWTFAFGGGGSHNNLQPYIVCYMWKRVS